MAGMAYIPFPWPSPPPPVGPHAHLGANMFLQNSIACSNQSPMCFRNKLKSICVLSCCHTFHAWNDICLPPFPPVAPHAYLGENMFLQNSIACSNHSPMCFKNKLNSICILSCCQTCHGWSGLYSPSLALPPVAPHAHLGANMFLHNSIACSNHSPMCFKNS